MYVTRITGTMNLPAANLQMDYRFGALTPPNGNPGIVPPWLQGGDYVHPDVVGTDPVGPDVPTIM